MRKQIIFNVRESDHQAIKLEAAKLKISIRDYIMNLIKEDLRQKYG